MNTWAELQTHSRITLDGLTPPMLYALYVAAIVYSAHGARYLLVESAANGLHSPESLHAQGFAIDVSTLNLREPTTVLAPIYFQLGPQFDVLLRATRLHIEYSPP